MREMAISQELRRLSRAGGWSHSTDERVRSLRTQGESGAGVMLAENRRRVEIAPHSAIS